MSGKEKLTNLIKDGEITVNEIGEVIGEVLSDVTMNEVVGHYDSHQFLDDIDGYMIDNELAINWGVNSLIGRIGLKGTLTVFGEISTSIILGEVDKIKGGN